MWAGRRWRKLLNFIDHLPRNSYYRQTEANDEEHARMVMKAMEGREDEVDPRPPMATWTTEVDKLSTLIWEIRKLSYLMATANGDKSAAKPKPEPRPRTAYDKAKHENRQAKHERLAARLLPHKAEKSD